MRKDAEKAIRITPGTKAPTISPLENPEWISVGVMVPSNQVAHIMDGLQDVGAKNIFILALENCRQ